MATTEAGHAPNRCYIDRDGPSDDDADLITLVANLALPGDTIRFWCDGTLWYGIGQTRLDGAVTTATT